MDMVTRSSSPMMMVKKGKKRARVSLKRNAMPKLPKKKIEKKTDVDKKPKSGKTLLIAQEVKFARLLANNDKKVRDKVLKNLKKWLVTRSQSSFAFTETDFLRLWKGLFYCMWMSDKPLVQEDLAESLSQLVHCFNSKDTVVLYTKCTLKSLSAEWFGIDRYRVDKFEMLVRKIIRQTFEVCKKYFWNEEWITAIGKVIQDILLDPKSSLGLNLHITEVYMEELAKISEGSIPKNMVTEFIRPFVIYLVSATDQRQMKHIVKNIFRYLIFQSDVGMDYTEKFHAWREAGFPCESIDEVQKIEISDEENEEVEEEINEKLQIQQKPLDPRAGRVDVEIPQIPFDPSEIASILRHYKFHKFSTTKSRKHIKQLIEDFTKLSEGDMPFGIKELPIPEITKISSLESAEQLLEFEKELYSDSNKNSYKRKKRSDSPEKSDDTIHTASQNDEAMEAISTKSKKLKLIGSDVFREEKNELEYAKKKKLNDKVIKMMEKQSKRLNISETISEDKVNVSKKLNKSLPESTLKTGAMKASCNGSKDSIIFNWKVDTVAPQTSTQNMVSLKNKIKQKKKKNLPNKKDDSSILKSKIPWLTPVLTRLDEQSKTPSPKKLGSKETPITKSATNQTPITDSAKKRVKIMLQKNTAQCTSEYFHQIKMSPSIPFDANRKPKAGVLKPSPLPSPVNPFYKKKMYFNNEKFS